MRTTPHAPAPSPFVFDTDLDDEDENLRDEAGLGIGKCWGVQSDLQFAVDRRLLTLNFLDRERKLFRQLGFSFFLFGLINNGRCSIPCHSDVILDTYLRQCCT